MGVPLWCFYVNRGQGICSFGTDGKDGAIMEYQPANKAYRVASINGFRTFIKCKNNLNIYLYEPFQDIQSNLDYDIENKMIISAYDLKIEEVNLTLGIKVSVTYFTIPNEPLAALARRLTVENISDTSCEFEVIDGMPQIMPFGVSNEMMKNMSRTIEAWYLIENAENNSPFYRLAVKAGDVTDVVNEKEGNFYISYIEDYNKIVNLKTIYDPDIIFGTVDNMTYPYNFYCKDFNQESNQSYYNKTPSAFGYIDFKLDGKCSKEIYSIIGHVKSLEELKSFNGKIVADYFVKKEIENKALINNLTDYAFINTDVKEFDHYIK